MKNMDIELMAKLLQNERKIGIAEGLRMAAEMLRERRWKAFKDGVPITDFEVYSRIIAKAKEVEEGKGEK